MSPVSTVMWKEGVSLLPLVTVTDSEKLSQTAPWDIQIGLQEKFPHGECGQALECIAQGSGGFLLPGSI